MNDSQRRDVLAGCYPYILFRRGRWTTLTFARSSDIASDSLGSTSSHLALRGSTEQFDMLNTNRDSLSDEFGLLISVLLPICGVFTSRACETFEGILPHRLHLGRCGSDAREFRAERTVLLGAKALSQSNCTTTASSFLELNSHQSFPFSEMDFFPKDSSTSYGGCGLQHRRACFPCSPAPRGRKYRVQPVTVEDRQKHNE